ncbi:MAG TPA: VWA domain-containing protein [Thermoanaerobaculia bacterium]|nr:VWA domain-containing protein [Thermoanaerobaculia bacterium]
MRALVLSVICCLLSGVAAAQVTEKISVERVIVDARVTDDHGDPITDLEPKDFRVKIDGKLVKVESAEWIPETAAARGLASIGKTQVENPNPDQQTAPAGRLLVFLIQTDFARNKFRLGGQMKVISNADEMIESLEPEDKVAVFQFDSHLKFRLDFTDDKARVKNAIRDALAIDEPNEPPTVPNPSLKRHLNKDEMFHATKPEMALLIVGNALRSIPGPKSLILLGWGLGERVNGRIIMPREYPIARHVLDVARTSVFSLDVTEADYHDLAVGMAQASGDTGGFYQSTFRFPQMAFDRLKSTLQGHYELEVHKPEKIVLGTHHIEVDVDRKNATVMARSTYIEDGQ